MSAPFCHDELGCPPGTTNCTYPHCVLGVARIERIKTELPQGESLATVIAALKQFGVVLTPSEADGEGNEWIVEGELGEDSYSLLDALKKVAAMAVVDALRVQPAGAVTDAMVERARDAYYDNAPLPSRLPKSSLFQEHKKAQLEDLVRAMLTAALQGGAKG